MRLTLIFISLLFAVACNGNKEPQANEYPNSYIDPFGLSKTPTRTLQKNWLDYVGSKHTNPDIHHGFPEEFANRFKNAADIIKGKHTKKPGIHTIREQDKTGIKRGAEYWIKQKR